MSSPNVFCLSEDQPILTKEDRSIKERKAKRKVAFGKLIEYETTKKISGKCVYLKNGKCSLKNKPILCESFPVFFGINIDDGSIVWLKHNGARLTQKKFKQAKKMLKEFMEDETVWKILVYLAISKNYNLKLIEEEEIPAKVLKKLVKVKNKLRDIDEGRKVV